MRRNERALVPHYARFRCQKLCCRRADVGWAREMSDRDLHDWKSPRILCNYTYECVVGIVLKEIPIFGEQQQTWLPSSLPLCGLDSMNTYFWLWIRRVHQLRCAFNWSLESEICWNYRGFLWMKMTNDVPGQRLLGLLRCLLSSNSDESNRRLSHRRWIAAELKMNAPAQLGIFHRDKSNFIFNFFSISFYHSYLCRLQSVSVGETMSRSGFEWLSWQMLVQLSSGELRWVSRLVMGDGWLQKGETRPSRFNWNVGHICIWKVFVSPTS